MRAVHCVRELLFSVSPFPLLLFLLVLLNPRSFTAFRMTMMETLRMTVTESLRMPVMETVRMTMMEAPRMTMMKAL